MPTPPAGLRQALLDACWLTLSAFLLYFACGQSTLYGDGINFMVLLMSGQVEHVQHVAYLPLLHTCRAALATLGCSMYAAALFASQAGGALGVGACYLGARGYGVDRGRACLVAAAVGLSPGVLFYATVIEVQGPFVGASALAWLLGAVLARRPGWLTAAGAGVGTGLATCAHSSGVLLIGPVLGGLLWPLWPRHAREPWRRRLQWAAVAGLLHAGLLLWAGGLGQFQGATRFATITSQLDKSPAAVVIWEWLLPFLPASCAFLLGFAHASWRKATAFTLVCVAGYLLPTYWALAYWREFGAYLIPLAFPVALITIHALRPLTACIAIAAGAAFGFAHVAKHDQPELTRAYISGVRAVLGGARGRLLAGDVDDLEGWSHDLEDVPMAMLSYPPFLDLALLPQTLAAIDRTLAADWQNGRVVLLTAGAERRLSEPNITRYFPATAAILAHLRARYALERITRLGFTGSIIRPRAPSESPAKR